MPATPLRLRYEKAAAELEKTARALVPYFSAAPADSLADLFHAQFLAEIPLRELKPLFQELHAAHGRCAGVRVTPGQDAY